MNKSLLASLHFLGISHHDQRMEVRSRYAVDDSQIAELHRRLRAIPELRGCVIITTCNRIEFVLDGGSTSDALKVLSEFYQVDRETLNDHFHYMDGWQVIRHVFRLTSGLDSMVLGDIQVTSQLKQAVKHSQEAGSLSPLLSRLCQGAFKAGKRVRFETGVSDGAASVTYTALLMAKEYLGPLNECSALVIGTGDVGRDVVYNLLEKGLKRLTVMNRTEDTGRSFAALVGGHFKPISDLASEIADHDIIITCTSAGIILISSELVQEREYKQLFLDLSLPPNIDSAVSDYGNVVRIDIDTIQNHIDQWMITRTNEIPKAEAIISEEMLSFQYRQIMDIASPAMVRLREEYEIIRQEELQRAATGLQPDTRLALEILSQRLVKRLAVLPIEIFSRHAEANTLAMEEILDASFN
ncbi:MAG: glutamyl-tRNA reductase [Candidatus Marinimicrobia bacterium]|nr:glutamyl-tRNA reductase [Candidatus Neomarinimicrobiota bacterium]